MTCLAFRAIILAANACAGRTARSAKTAIIDNANTTHANYVGTRGQKLIPHTGGGGSPKRQASLNSSTMHATNDTVQITRAEAVMTLTLNRPDKLNAIDSCHARALARALAEAAVPDVRAVVITGAGKGFCVGQDLAELTPDADVGELVRTHYNANMLALRALAKPRDHRGQRRRRRSGSVACDGR